MAIPSDRDPPPHSDYEFPNFENSPKTKRHHRVPSIIKKTLGKWGKSDSENEKSSLLDPSLTDSGDSFANDLSPKSLESNFGLTEQEQHKINDFVKNNKKKWCAELLPGEKHIHIKHDSIDDPNGILPRSLDVFIDKSKKLHVMVRLKCKKGVQPLGGGAFKTPKIAIDWINKKLYADIVIKGEEIKEFNKEYIITNKLAQEKGIIKPYLGKHLYTNKSGKEVLGAYSPKYEETLLAFTNNGKIHHSDLLQIFKDLCDGILTLEQKGIEHRDLKEDNIYLQIEKKVIKAVIADFGCVYEGPFPNHSENNTPRSELNDYLPEMYNKLFTPPEKRALLDIFTGLKHHKQENPETTKKFNEVKNILINSQKLYDTWAMGLIFLGLLSGERKREKPESPLVNKHALHLSAAIDDMLKYPEDRPIEKSKEPNCNPHEIMNHFYEQFQEIVDHEIEEVKKIIENNSIEDQLLQITKRMLFVNPSTRIHPEIAVQEIKKINHN